MPAFRQSHLRCFVTTAELGSISAAAKRLHRTPSAISMTLSNLETQFGRPLFETGNKGRLTPFGEFVRDTASAQLRQFDRSMETILAYSRNEFGRIDIAAVPSIAAGYLPELLAEFTRRYPQVEISIRDDSSAQINRLVERGEVDVGIASPMDATAQLEYRPLFSDPLGVVCSATHPLCDLDRPLDWKDLRADRFIANGTCAHIEDPAFAEILSGSDLDVQNTTSLLALVAAGIGITTLPRLAVPADRTDIRFLPTGYAGLQRDIGILLSAQRSLAPAAANFVAAVEDAFREGEPGAT